MIQKLLLFFLLLFLPFSVFSQTGESTLTGALEDIVPVTLVSTTNTSSSGIFSLLDKRNTEQLKISETQASIDYERELQKTTEAQGEDLQNLKLQAQKLALYFISVDGSGSVSIPQSSLGEFTLFFSQYKALFVLPDNLEESPQVFQKNQEAFLSNIESKEQELQALLKASKEKSQIHIKELEEFQNQLSKTQLSIQLQLFDAVKKAGSFLTLILGTFLLARLSTYLIQKKSHFPEEKKKIIISLVHFARNSIIITIIIVFFFSELLNFLPFLAILGTAIGFALRDVISSFIAWFVIGLKDTTYKLGDVIEIPRDGIFGEVVKIHPLVTTIKELGLSGPNSKFRTFPNKLIFETSLNNLWKYGGWTFISVECMVTYTSDIELARTLLLESMNEVCTNADFTYSADAKARLKKLGIPEKNQVPQVFVDVRTQGVFLRGKMLVMWNERHEIRNRTVIVFTQKVKDASSVELRYVDFWVNELR